MKIEKINDRQIRCTLTGSDLKSRQIQLGELAYGSNKARELFSEMMQKAHREFGFDAENEPLMIEAIPVSSDSIVLVITKVEDPDELDARFSRFTKSLDDPSQSQQFSGAEDVLELFRKICEARAEAAGNQQTAGQKKTDTPAQKPVDLIQAFEMSSLDDAVLAAHSLKDISVGRNALYKNAKGRGYLLVVHQSETSPEEFNRIANILSEFGEARSFSPAEEAWLKESGTVLIASDALGKLAEM